jgi:GTP-binding protein HflX
MSLPPDEERKKSQRSGAFLVGLHEPSSDLQESREHLDELRELVATLNTRVVGEVLATLRQPSPKYLLGSGKAQEIKDAAIAANAAALVFDTELGPSQQRNWEKFSGLQVIDRQEVILDIFADRASTREAVLQVELARHKYFLTRLVGAWGHLSRQQGGALGTRGEGEKQIETDRRLAKRKISQMERELLDVRRQRDVQRKSRVRHEIPHAAIVGYTNAGKSSLLNHLTKAGVLVEDKLFATLDPTTRKLTLPDKQEMLLTDTVGFIRKLPHNLVEAFKSTLEEAVLSDFVILVLDSSSPHVESHWETTLAVLAELGAEGKPMIVAFNKCDLERDPVAMTRLRALNCNGVFISCRTGEGVDKLLQALASQLRSQSSLLELEIPASRPDLVALLHAKGRVIESKYLDDGSFSAAVRLSAPLARDFAQFAAKPKREPIPRKTASRRRITED